MILLLTAERDLTSDYIILELQKRNAPYRRLNAERFPSFRVAFRPASGKPKCTFHGPEGSFQLSDITAGYFRRPGAPAVSDTVVAESDRRYCAEEWRSLLRSLSASMRDRWLNSPAAIAAAEDKPLQLALAVEAGFKVPRTLVTNDPGACSDFLAENPKAIIKALNCPLFAEGNSERVVFTSRVSEQDLLAERIEVAPFILQQQIEKRCDVRVTVVGSHVFAVAIHSQITEETRVDWRRGSNPALPHHPHELPVEVTDKCIRITQNLGLRFSAIDLVLDRSGEYWFLEANPNGQWAWLEHRTGAPITRAIVDQLLEIASDHKRGG